MVKSLHGRHLLEPWSAGGTDRSADRALVFDFSGIHLSGDLPLKRWRATTACQRYRIPLTVWYCLMLDSIPGRRMPEPFRIADIRRPSGTPLPLLQGEANAFTPRRSAG